MNIAFLLGSLNRGGTETLILDVFREHRLASFSILGIYRKEGAISKEFKQSGVPVQRICPGFTGDPAYFFRLRKHLIKNKTDIVHAHQAIDALYAKIACLGTGIKVVLTFHGYNYRYGRLRNLITRLIINRTNLNLFVSNSQKENYFEKYSIHKPSRNLVVYNGISFEKFVDFPKHSIREEFNIPESAILLTSVGNFVKVRDQMTICKFLHLLKKENADFAFIFAGGKDPSDPDKYDRCVDYCREHNLLDKVFFPGSRTDIPNILSQADAFIYSTRFDTFGIAVIEAIYMGIPVFVNDWEVIHEITDGGKHANIYQTSNENQLLELFRHYIDNKSNYHNKAQDAARWVADSYSISKHIKSLEKAYSKVV